MKKSEFPEKAFEMYINHFLLEEGFNLYIPSQAKEAKLAYDALINDLKAKKGKKIMPLALQYKIVWEYKRPEPAKKFKFDLHANCDKRTKKLKYTQHNILYKKNLSSKYFAAGYVVPYFVSYKELQENVINDTLLNNSYFIRPQHHISDSGYHYYTFDNIHALQHSSEPLNDEIQPFEELLSQIAISGKDFAQPIEGFIEEFTSILESNIANNKEEFSEESTRKVYPVIAYKLFD